MKLSDINKLRRTLFKTNVYLGDLNAILRGKFLSRIQNRIVGRWVGKGFRKLFKK